MPGSQVHANFIDSILSNRFMRPAGPWIIGTAVAICVLIVGVGSVTLGPWNALAMAGVVSVGLVWVSLALFRQGLWIPLIRPIAGVALATFGGMGYHYFVEGREKRKVKRLFSRFVSRDVYTQLLAEPSRATLGGQRREMSVLFSDIRGFTTVSERSEPEEIVRTLNEYFTRQVKVVFAHRGTVDKFVGDMIMALFGAPLDDPDHADHAVQTALAMIDELHGLNKEWAAQGRPTLDIGVGVNSGDMVAGIIGSEAIMSYTVIGDNVNLGSRLESLNKQYNCHIIISENTRQRLKRRYDIRPLGDVVVKGKTQPVAIFEVVGQGPDAPAAVEAGAAGWHA